MKEIIEIKSNDDIFPDKLKKIKKSPAKLYAIGNVKLLNKPSLAVIGTRHITSYGIKNCEHFTQKIVEMDIPIISGMAIGTDTIAHKTALKYGGETIAVLAGGFNKIYPKQNIKLFDEIIDKNGLIITEYPIETSVNSDRFLERNRIVSGLSEGVLVIEAAYRSGTSVTAKLAYSQGKVVMALPGRLDSSYGVGVNKLIKNGAKLVSDIDDILINFPQFCNKKWKTHKETQLTFWDIKEEYMEIAKIIGNNILTIEEINYKTKNKNIIDTINLLINMELENLVQQQEGGFYKLVK